MLSPAGEKAAREHESGGRSGYDDGPPQGQGQGRDEGMLWLPASLAVVHVGGYHRDRRRDAHRLSCDGDHYDRHQQQRCLHRERESFHDYHGGRHRGRRRRRRRHPRSAILQHYLPSANDGPQHRGFLLGRPRLEGQE